MGWERQWRDASGERERNAPGRVLHGAEKREEEEEACALMRAVTGQRTATECPPNDSTPCPSRARFSRAPSRHLVHRNDIGLVLEQQPHNRLVAVPGSHDEACVL